MDLAVVIALRSQGVLVTHVGYADQCQGTYPSTISAPLVMDGPTHGFRHAKQPSPNQFPGAVQKRVRDRAVSKEVTCM